ncbi:hypothetical protein [Burkholderia stabilis]|nr:hypothetical protein [Burkholderia stabilis]
MAAALLFWRENTIAIGGAAYTELVPERRTGLHEPMAIAKRRESSRT